MNSILISGTRSGVGKTTVTTAVLSLFENSVPFKLGPDYIDPMFHKFICGYDSINLDLFMLNEETVKSLYTKHSCNKEIAILEGMMGLYDGLGNDLDNYSSAHISRVLKIPVILVVDGNKISTSIAAIIKGYEQFDSRVEIKGIIINKVSEAMYLQHKYVIEKYTNTICLGFLPYDEQIVIKERHLGLMQTSEIKNLRYKIDKLKEIAKNTIDIEEIKRISKTSSLINSYNFQVNKIKNIFKGVKIGIAKDRAFSFYYADNIQLLKYSGMDIEYFSPLEDKHLPDVDCLYIGGGYPEIYSKELSENQSLLNDIKQFSDSNKLIYAECGGMMYLSEYIESISGIKYKMCGVLNHNVKMSKRLNINKFGYISLETSDGIKVKGHEFHYSDVYNTEKSKYYYKVNKINNEREWKDGFFINNTIAGYPHIHFYSNLDFFISIFNRVSIKNLID